MRRKVKKTTTKPPMCSKSTTAASGLKPTTMISKNPKKVVKPARRARTKIKKQKFLSLRLQLSSETSQKTQQQPTETPPTSPSPSAANNLQLNLFPLHPENSTEEKDTHDENMANYFFSAADGGATTLTGLLNSSTTSSSEADNATTTSVSLSYAYEDGALLRTALRRNKDQRDESEERWVCYSEVVERRSEEEVTSCAAVDDRIKLQKLALKLDYEEIMNAWCDRGPLYIHADSPQIVPDINDDVPPHETSYGLQDCWGSSMGLWKVPETKTNESNGDIRREEEGQVGEELKQAQREASVLRYKEKRQNRLFAKRIRYEVRKLNAEKRPRVKGRFVKRS